MRETTRTAYRYLSKKTSTKEIKDIFAPSDKDIQFASSVAKKPIAQIGALLLLKSFQHLGYFIKLSEIHSDAIYYLVEHSQLSAKKIKKSELLKYDNSASRLRHIQQIRKYSGVTAYSNKYSEWLYQVAREAAETKYIVADIINVLLEELVRKKLELPGFQTLKRAAAKARKEVHDSYFSGVTASLSEVERNQIDSLFKRDNNAQFSDWNVIKREPRKLSNKEVKSFIKHVRWLEKLRKSLPDFEIPPAKLRQFRAEAQSLDAAEMAALRPLKRYALACILINSQHATGLDNVTRQFVRLYLRMENKAQNDLTDYLLRQQKVIDHLVRKFRGVLEGYIDNDALKKKMAAIDSALDGEEKILIEQCEEHMAYAGNNYFPFMMKYFKQARSILIDCLELLNIQSTSSDQLTIQLIHYLLSIKNRKATHIRPEELDQFIGRKIGTDWMPDKWRKQIRVKGINGTNDVFYNRKYLELCILSIVKREFSSIDLYVPLSAEYSDHRESIIDDETFDGEISLYAKQVNMPVDDPAKFVAFLKDQIIRLSKKVDSRFPDNSHASMKNGKLSLKQYIKKAPHEHFDKTQNELSNRIEPVSIMDAITDVTKWLNLDKHLTPLSGNESRIDQPTLRFILTMFCYGCNFGPGEVERSVKGLTSKQIGWLNNKHTSLEKLIDIDREIINKYKRFKLPFYWGTGKSASVDGTKWDLFEQNLMSEFHIRHGGYGGMGYYHVSDTYIALFSHFIQCGVYEGTYIIDGLLKNDSDIQPNTIHGDTHSQNFPVFALSHLLGIKLMPRIKNIQDLNLYRPDKRFKYKNIDDLFSESIDFKRIETHLRDMMKIVISIQKGKISSSTILKRLSSSSRKNKLYYAFKELGKAIRTLFLLEYIDKVELRRMINAATNKSESFNAFAKWLFFGNNGVIAQNLKDKQQFVVKYNQVVANMITFYNVVKMEEVFEQLTKEGHLITPELLAEFSPYRQSTINRYGKYEVDDNKKLPPIDFNKIIISVLGQV